MGSGKRALLAVPARCGFTWAYTSEFYYPWRGPILYRERHPTWNYNSSSTLYSVLDSYHTCSITIHCINLDGCETWRNFFPNGLERRSRGPNKSSRCMLSFGFGSKLPPVHAYIEIKKPKAEAALLENLPTCSQATVFQQCHQSVHSGTWAMTAWEERREQRSFLQCCQRCFQLCCCDVSGWKEVERQWQESSSCANRQHLYSRMLRFSNWFLKVKYINKWPWFTSSVTDVLSYVICLLS